MSRSSSTLQLDAAWWDGLSLWYNQGMYGEAMDVFWDALDESHGVASAPHTVRDLPPKHSEDLDETEDSPKDNEIISTAMLLIFLAGCYLDATEIRRAKQCLHTSLRLVCTNVSHSATTCHRSRHCRAVIADAVQEYMSAEREDPECSSPWLQERRLVQWVVDDPAARSNPKHNEKKNYKWTDSYQRAAHMYPNIPSQAIYPTLEHPSWCRTLEEHWKIVQSEFRDLRSSQAPWPAVGGGDHRDGAGRHDCTVVDGGGDWREMVLFGSGGHPNRAPRTSRLLQQHCPDAVSLAEAGAGEIIFSLLQPHTHIRPHTASHNVRLTAHLGLSIPEDKDNCYLRVGAAICRWEEGRVLVFDDSYEHEVVNQTDESRAILLLRFWHPSIPVHTRNHALQTIVTAKHEDLLRRYNPPTPYRSMSSSSSVWSVSARGLEQSRCVQCGNTGHSSIRIQVEARQLVCVCGTVIDE